MKSNTEKTEVCWDSPELKAALTKRAADRDYISEVEAKSDREKRKTNEEAWDGLRAAYESNKANFAEFADWLSNFIDGGPVDMTATYSYSIPFRPRRDVRGGLVSSEAAFVGKMIGLHAAGERLRVQHVGDRLVVTVEPNPRRSNAKQEAK